jgi:hypothetical protein
MESGEIGDSKVVRTRWIWGACATTWGHGDVWAWAVDKGYGWDCGSTKAFCAGVCGLNYRQRPCGCLKAMLPPSNILIWVSPLLPEAMVTSGPMLVPEAMLVSKQVLSWLCPSPVVGELALSLDGHSGELAPPLAWSVWESLVVWVEESWPWWRAVPTALVSCNTWESGPNIFPGQHNRTGPGGRNVGKLTLPLAKLPHLGEMAPPFICCVVARAQLRCPAPRPVPLSPHQLQQVGELAWGHESRRSVPNPTLGKGKSWLLWCGQRRAGGWTIQLPPRPRSRALSWPIPTHLWTAGANEGVSPADSKLQDLHGTWQPILGRIQYW